MSEFSDYVAGTRNWQATFTGNALLLGWGGGAGAGAGVGLTRGGGGGGGGSFVVGVRQVILGQLYPYTIGAGGTGGIWSGGVGEDGGDTFWGDGTYLRAKGGKGGSNIGGQGGSGPDGLGDSRTSGFPGAPPTSGLKGGKGGDAGGAQGGPGGPAPIDQHGGFPGIAPGGGGSGGGQLSDGHGGAGAPGGLIIMEAPEVEPGSYLVGVSSEGVYDDPGIYEWTPPADGFALIQNSGSGGGARGGQSLGNGGAGAGGGAYSLSAVAVTANTVYERLVPTGGLGSGLSSSASTDGADAIFREKVSGIVLVKAAGGKRSTGTTSGAGAGGLAADSIGETTASGDTGITGISTSQNGGNGGGGALPMGGAGGAGGDKDLADKAGQPGVAPGGGGGGGSAVTGGSGGPGAKGAVVISYFITFGSVIRDGEEKYIIRIQYKDTEGVVHLVDKPSRIQDGVRKPITRLRPDLSVTARAKPPYIPVGHESKFDISNGTFNWVTGAPNTPAAILSGNFEFTMIGDSLAEGWTYLNEAPPYNFTSDFPNAFPRWTRNYIAQARGLIVGGEGLIRANSVGGGDPAWDKGDWNSTIQSHYLYASSGGRKATFTSRLEGSSVAVVTSGPACSVTIDGIAVGSTQASAASTPVRAVFGSLDPGTHVVAVTSTAAGTQLFGSDVYFPGSGVRVHNVAQGGSKAAFGADTSPDQPTWSDMAPGSPSAMTPVYSQQTALFGRAVDSLVVCLGGNDSFQDIPPAPIAAAHDIIGTAFETPTTDIILMPDVHTEDRMAALMQLCLDKNWAMVDFFWLSRNLATVFGQGYAGDTFGHLNVAGAKWCGNLLAQGLMSGL